MKFKVGDKVMLKGLPQWYGGMMKINEECVITNVSTGSDMIWVCNANGDKTPVYKSWASMIIKNQQLLFNFME